MRTESIRQINQKREYYSKIHQRDVMALPLGLSRPDLLGINVPASFEQGVIPDHEEPPFGLLRVLNSAQKEGNVIGIIDAHKVGRTLEQLRSDLIKLHPRMVALNPTSVNVPEAMDIAMLCDELGLAYIVGGVHATIDPLAARKDFPNAYAIVKGHGEVAITEIMKRINGLQEGPIGAGILYSDEKTINARDYAVKLPVKDIPIVDQSKLVEEPLYKHEVVIKGKKVKIYEATLDTTDGCPYNCGFCCSPLLVGRGTGIRVYDRPPTSRIVDEIEHAIVDMGANAIHFVDDMAFVTPKHVHELYEELRARDLLGKFVWRGMTRANIINKFDDETMKELVETGLWKLAIGVESGDDDVLKSISKGISAGDVRSAIKKISSYDIASKGFFILGFPGETEDQMKRTIDLALTLKEDGMTDMSMFQFKPYPGTNLTEQLIANHPEIVDTLTYLRNGSYSKGTALTEGDMSARARSRAMPSVWLPDDLKIAEIPSSEVKSLILQTYDAFYNVVGNSF